MRKREYWLLVTPSLVVMVGLLALPLYRTIEWSLQRVSYGDPGTFVGLSNYTAALTDPRFGRAVVFTVGLTLVVTAILVVLGYLLAIAVNRLRRMRPLVLGLLLLSYVIPGLVGATMFSWLFDTNFGGPLDLLISRITGQHFLWFTDTWPNRVVLTLNIVWFMLPFAMLVILAGLQSVSPDVLEAAKIDGARSFRLHWNVIIPSVRGVVGFVVLISLMDVVRVFDPLIPLSPQATAIGNESITYYIFNVAFANGGQQLGLGSAVNVLLTIIIGIILVPSIRATIREGA